jgi:hypothetical protein
MRYRVRPISINLPGATSKSAQRAKKLGLTDPETKGENICEFLKQTRHSTFTDDVMEIELSPAEAEKEVGRKEKGTFSPLSFVPTMAVCVTRLTRDIQR